MWQAGRWLDGFPKVMATMLRKFLLVLGLMGLAACAAPAERANMAAYHFIPFGKPFIPPAKPKDASLIGGVAVGTVDGGQSTNPLWTSEVGNEGFRGALRSEEHTSEL